jgi:hypothetical protein
MKPPTSITEMFIANQYADAEEADLRHRKDIAQVPRDDRHHGAMMNATMNGAVMIMTTAMITMTIATTTMTTMTRRKP